MRTYGRVLLTLALIGAGTAVTYAQDEVASLDVAYSILHPDFPYTGLYAQRIGENTAPIGDINGDGFDDWCIGRRQSVDYGSVLPNGSVHIFLGGAIPDRCIDEYPEWG